MTTGEDSSTLIIGASRGLGLGLANEFLARGRRVIGTVRDPERSTPLHDLARRSDGRLRIEQVDVTALQQLEELRARLQSVNLDILLVNAGIMERDPPDFAGAFMRSMATNALGPIMAIRMLSHLVRADGVIAAMSSGKGSISNNLGGREPYSSSKAALNQLLRSFAAEHADRPWSVTAIAPGWVRTDMGGPNAPFSVETSAKRIADVLDSRLGARGSAFLNYLGQVIPW